MSDGKRSVSKLMTHTDYVPRLSPLSVDAEWAWAKLRLYCAWSGNDGKMPAGHLLVALERKVPVRRAERAIEELVAAGLVERAGEKLVMPGWLDEQPSVEQWTDPVQHMRWRRAKELQKDWKLRNAIKERDGDLCQYEGCGIRVRWTDKRSREGGTYDHIDPDGPNSMENVVVACRGCNGAKKDRTPEQWVADDPVNGRLLRNDPRRSP